LILHTGGIFLPVEYFWGVDQWRYFPTPVIISFILSGLFLCTFPPFKNLSHVQTKYTIFNKKIYYIIIPLCSFPPFWFLRQKTFFLGDGYLWLRNLEYGIRFSAHEPLEMYLHSVVHSIAHNYFSATPQTTWTLTSMLCGVLFVSFVMLISNLMGKTALQKFIIMTALLSMGTIQLFFGYVETYTIAALLTVLFIYFALKSFKSPRFLFPSVFTFSFAVCAHPSVAGFFPAFIYLFILRMRNLKPYRDKLRFTLLFILWGIIPVLFTIFVFFSGGFTLKEFVDSYSGGSHFLPLSSENLPIIVAYSLFSFNHIVDIINEYLLIAPLSIFILTFILFNLKIIKTVFSEKSIVFLSIGALFSLCFCFIFNLEIGASRDWDIFSASAISFTLASVLIILKFSKNYTNKMFIVLSCCILHTLPWILVNNNENSSFKRFVRLAHSKTWSNYAQAYAFDELRTFYKERDDFTNAVIWAEKAYALNKSNDRLRNNLAAAYNNLAIQSFQNNNFSDAETYFKAAYTILPEDFNTIENLGNFYLDRGYYDKALEFYNKAVKIQPNDTMVLANIAIAYYNKGDYKNAEYFINQALSVNEDGSLTGKLLETKKAIETR